MNLLDLDLEPSAPGGVPGWAQGCFRRRHITYFTGTSDTTTLVIWLQSRTLSFDLRLAPECLGARRDLRPEFGSRDQLLAWTQAEGGIARSVWTPDPCDPNAGVMRWQDWTSFQVHARWPEPGMLRRVGDCMIEFAPSGAYVEDWRLQPTALGGCVGLALVSERDCESGATRHTGGGLVICGEHAGLVRGRARALPAGDRLETIACEHAGDPGVLGDVFAFEASYARRDASGDYVVAHSTVPVREGTRLLSLEGFDHDPKRGTLLQRTLEQGRRIERVFQVESFDTEFRPSAATHATEEACEWLEHEHHGSLRGTRARPQRG